MTDQPEHLLPPTEGNLKNSGYGWIACGWSDEEWNAKNV